MWRDGRFILHYRDLTNATNLLRIVQDVQSDEIYNLAAQTGVTVSFETKEYTADADTLRTLRALETIRILGLEHRTRLYSAPTSELFCRAQEIPWTERTSILSRPPYAHTNLCACWIALGLESLSVPRELERHA
jgi:GDPmannose 4,6-dehydratase